MNGPCPARILTSPDLWGIGAWSRIHILHARVSNMKAVQTSTEHGGEAPRGNGPCPARILTSSGLWGIGVLSGIHATSKGQRRACHMKNLKPMLAKIHAMVLWRPCSRGMSAQERRMLKRMKVRMLRPRQCSRHCADQRQPPTKPKWQHPGPQNCKSARFRGPGCKSARFC